MQADPFMSRVRSIHLARHPASKSGSIVAKVDILAWTSPQLTWSRSGHMLQPHRAKKRLLQLRHLFVFDFGPQSCENSVRK